MKRAPGPGEMFITGVEYHDGEQWRLYVNNRWMWKYVLVDRETAKQVWHVLGGQDRIIVPIPEGATIHQVPVEERWEGPDGEKAAWERTRAGLE
ncbi:hypothetical protein PBI_DEWDROP_118 [Microbacterium phage Dewdrop]|nr:hypothetical protein PBI_LEAF_118 [Microbacterium phage Leaf]QGZ17486.1 hypothetical protein PBI_DEWDROP_118 [Microbacterium phage Dewdrop]